MADLTPERLQELRRIAEAATPGPWEWDKYLHLFSATGKPVLTKPFSPDNPDVVEARPEDLDYIERFDPETALALLDRIDALEAMLLRLYQDTVVPDTHYCHRCGINGGHDESCAMAEVEVLLGLTGGATHA